MQEIHRLSLYIFVLLVLPSLNSCAAKSINIQTSSILTNTPLPQITSTSTEPTIETTPNIFPTLEPDSAYAELEKIFENNRCQFPCWWGIEPGTTSISDAETKLNGYYQIAPSEVINDGLLLDLSVSIVQQENIRQVNVIRIREQVLRRITGGYEWVYDEQAYTDLLGAYSLKSILDTYGRPTDISATIEIYLSEANAPDFMMIWLLYPEKGFIAKYTANAELNNNEIVTGCPTKSFFTFWLFPPDQNGNYNQLNQLDPDLGYIVPTLSERTKPISEGFGISIDDFYKIFTQPNDKCLETPYNIWPGW
jgi:hypothetical protein